MPMITIADDTNTAYMANITSECLIYKKSQNAAKATGEKVKHISIFIKDGADKTFLLEYHDINMAQKVWDRLCEITGAKDIFDIGMENENYQHIDEPDPEPEIRYI